MSDVDPAVAFAERFKMEVSLVSAFMGIARQNPEVSMVLGRLIANMVASSLERNCPSSEYLVAVRQMSTFFSLLTNDEYSGLEVKAIGGVEGVSVWDS